MGVLHSSVLYCIKRGGWKRKKLENLLTSKEQSDNQTDGSKTETTLILCRYSRERANNRGDRTIKEEVRRRKMRKFAYKETIKEQSSKQANVSNTETTLILCGYSRERTNNFVEFHKFYRLL